MSKVILLLTQFSAGHIDMTHYEYERLEDCQTMKTIFEVIRHVEVECVVPRED